VVLALPPQPGFPLGRVTVFANSAIWKGRMSEAAWLRRSGGGASLVHGVQMRNAAANLSM
jgi:hypothetical protein